MTQGFKSNGKTRTRLELNCTKLDVKDLLKNMIVQLGIYHFHVRQYQWINWARKIDLVMSDPEICRIFCTDVGAALDVCASENDNYRVDNHAVICIFFAITNWRRLYYQNYNKWYRMRQ